MALTQTGTLGIMVTRLASGFAVFAAPL